MGFLDELRKAKLLPPEPQPEVCPEPFPSQPARLNVGSGDNEVYLVRVPYPAEGSATVDFALQLMRPAKSIYYPVIMNPGTPLAAYAFTPQGINLAAPIPSTINNPLFDLVPGQLTRWKTAFNKIYVSVNGYGVGGFITLLVSDGMELLTANPAATTDLHKLTTIETQTLLAANGVFTGAWHDSQADGVLFVMVSAFSAQAGTFVIQESDDISNANFTKSLIGSVNVAVSTLARYVVTIKARYWRIVYTNGATLQTSFELSTTASDILNGINSSTDVTNPGNPITFIESPQGVANLADELAVGNYTSFPALNLPNPVALLTATLNEFFGGAFSGTPNAALQNWSRARTSTVFKRVSTVATGSTALWTPGAGNKFRLLKLYIQVTATAALAVAGDLTISLLDSATDIAMDFIVSIPAAGLTVGDDFSQFIDLGTFGILSAVANNVLNVNLSAALTAGHVNVIAMGTEE